MERIQLFSEISRGKLSVPVGVEHDALKNALATGQHPGEHPG